MSEEHSSGHRQRLLDTWASKGSFVAVDLDGTLLRPDFSVSRRTRDAVERFFAAGFVLVAATARSPRAVCGLIEHAAGLRGMAICSNGALLVDLSSRTIISRHCIPPQMATEVISQLREAMPGITFAIESDFRFCCEPSYPARPTPGTSVIDSSEFTTLPIAKLLAFHPALPRGALSNAVESRFGGYVEVTHSTTQELLEISGQGVDKGAAVAEVASLIGVSAAETMAVGDMVNDASMLRWAGIAVAVANAHPSILAIADVIVASNEHDGIAEVLERLVNAKRGA